MLPQSVRRIIKDLSNKGHSVSYIAKTVGHSRTAIQFAIGNPVDVKKKPVPGKLTVRDQRQISRLVKNSRITTARAIKATLGLDCHKNTVKNALRKLGFNYRTCRRIQHLENRHLTARMEFARGKLDAERLGQHKFFG